LKNIIIILCFGLVPAIAAQFFKAAPKSRHITVTSFRYGKTPSVIRCNSGDTLLLTFKTKDTGHSFFLEEFDVDAKVSPSREDVTVFKTSDPTIAPVDTKELTIIARRPGIMNYLGSRSNYRCHVWCGPMHAFEQGKLVIFPNTLFIFSLGCIAGILFLWVSGIYKTTVIRLKPEKDLLSGRPLLEKLVKIRWPQLLAILVAMVMIYIVILTAVLGTKVSGRNLGVLLMWAIWLFFLVALLTPLMGRIWCTICPLPVIGDWFQRRSFFSPGETPTGNVFHGLWLKWPSWLSNDWPKLFLFMALATFSTTLVAVPFVSGITVLMLLLVPTFMAMIWEQRAFCRYLCPVSVFVGPFSRMSALSLRKKSDVVCSKCRKMYCKNGSEDGWACPWGIDTATLNDSSECGLCLECARSCKFKNVTLYKRPFATELSTGNYGQAWQSIAIFTLAIVYSILYEGHWPWVRDYVNILDKKNWDLFGIYALVVWALALVVAPAVIYGISAIASLVSSQAGNRRDIFLKFSGTLLPLGLMLWIAFVIPMLFVNISFILQSLSDPFGWGWDFLGTANTPWHQLFPGYIPLMQSVLILTGLHLSLRNLRRSFSGQLQTGKHVITFLAPMALFLSAVAAVMIVFFTN
jgi:polyferredoxin